MRPSFLFLALLVSVWAAGLSSSVPNVSNPFTMKKFATISGKRMAYVEYGTGDPIIFLHGNPTSSYLWRNIMPYLKGRGRLIAPDLIGMGDSDKLDNSGPNRYTFFEHANYLYQLLEHLGVKENVTLIIHDWGSALGFLWAYRNRFNPNAVKAIVFFEGIVAPFKSYDDVREEDANFFKQLRSPEGEKLVLEDNIFIEFALFQGLNLTEEEKNVYRKPFLNAGEDRRPMLTWARQVPIAGEPEDVDKVVRAYSEWLGTSKVRKLFINAEPGFASPIAREIVRFWPEVTTVTLPGFHFIQESVPDEIGMVIKDWL